MKKLSAVINTKNAAATLKKTLESVKFADEIIVVDMHSVDDTRKIAQKYTSKIFLHKDLKYADPARDFAINKANGDLILVIDADEIVPADLKKYIKTILTLEKTADIYLSPRQNIIFGQKMKHTGWWPDYHPRLFKKGQIKWPSGVHQHPVLSGKVQKLPEKESLALIHHNYQDVASYFEKLNIYTQIKAEEASSGFGETVTPVGMIQAFFDEFFKRFFVLSGYKDQVAGIGLSFLQAAYELTVKLKIWELQDQPENKQSPQEIVNALEITRNHLNYWLADWKVKNTAGLINIYWRIRRKLRF